jgi:hypothetical protein
LEPAELVVEPFCRIVNRPLAVIDDFFLQAGLEELEDNRIEQSE